MSFWPTAGLHTMTHITASIVPNLWFDREAEQAAQHYIAAFGGNGRIVNTIASHPESPSPQDVPVVVEFELAGQHFVGINGGPQFTFTEAVSLEVRVTGQEQLDQIWAALVEGGEELPCGWLKDKYGLAWQITPTEYYDLLAKGNPAGDARLMSAVLSTVGKFDIAALQAAYHGA
ncbi:VOC family protein [Mycobacterium sp. URHD0025]|uniref:VOC family protein n=1 Tax=Mycobacterium sp. URHD0025 TaxID=1298864 RepID=UPI0003F910A5|nr:VOC family protein [Mycobacterium sp. URHD0025]